MVVFKGIICDFFYVFWTRIVTVAFLVEERMNVPTTRGMRGSGVDFDLLSCNEPEGGEGDEVYFHSGVGGEVRIIG